MSIDWFTFSAQIVNFLVLVWLLKRFLYGPIMRAMDERDRDMAERAREVASAKLEAEQQSELLRNKQQELDHAREELLAKANIEIEDWKKRHLQDARSEIDRARSEWYRAIEMERSTFLRDLRQQVGSKVYEIARQVLDKLSTAALEELILVSFLDRLRQIDEPRRNEIASTIRDHNHPVLVETAFVLPESSRNRIQSMIHEVLGNGSVVDFKEAAELIGGIEMKAAGYKVAWSIGETLDELEEEFQKTLEETLPR